ncbi:MAG TPA: SDR family NAD(P)-dependent oxidoreductase, partial [Pyrinomonadaceae bacterium]|nr:SDR family NAD(P)-dependent oxidoreductase [Pyrinomonadaceae bacterium]
MRNEQEKQSSENQQSQETQVSRRSFIEKGVFGLGAMALAGNASGQTKSPVEPKPDKANPNGKFAGKVVLITGATSGIGEGTAYAFAKEGAKVFLCGRRENLGKQVEAKIRSFDGEATYLKADVRKEDDVKNFIDACVKKYGRVDIAFNNAGIVNPKIGKLHEQPSADFADVLQTNTFGIFYSLKYEIPQMLKQGGGFIINMASVSGHKGFSEIGPYSTSKHGVLGLTKVAAMEYAKDNIRITSISPGGVDTPMLR